MIGALGGGRQPVIFMYHGFCESRLSNDPENLFVEVSALQAQMRFLLDRGWTPLTLDQWLDVRAGLRPRPPKSFLLTIDDAFVSVADLALPVLARLGVPCVLFVPVGLTGRTAEWLPDPPDVPILSRERLLALDGSLVDLGVHGWDHTPMSRSDTHGLSLQVERSREELASVTDRPPRAFAYPFGDHDEQARAAVAGAGFDVAFSVFDDVGTMAVSRVDVNATDTVRSFRVKTLPGYRRLWRMAQHVAFARRLLRVALTRGQ
ncbi:polysaccharide deacetylase family protein [Janibacter alittae]|uniref:Polysaccharide deacetylase family protein n=1 Tax=Janibacter alittae TaxID=3115209 RepID=A0ABZ2MGN7_9MICO